MHLAQHLTALDGIDYGSGAVECGRGGLELGESKRDSGDCHQTNDDKQRGADTLLQFRFSGTLNIHELECELTDTERKIV